MKYHPASKNLYSDQGDVIKQLDCPYRAQDLRLTRNGTNSVNCSACDHSVLLAHAYRDQELLQIVQAEPDTCLLIDTRYIALLGGEPHV